VRALHHAASGGSYACLGVSGLMWTITHRAYARGSGVRSGLQGIWPDRWSGWAGEA